MTIECLGPASREEIKDLQVQIEADGANYVAVPPVQGVWPNMSSGKMYAEEWVETVTERLERIANERKRKDEAVARIRQNIIPAGWQSAAPMQR